MQPIESTAEVLILKILDTYYDKTWVTWAVDMLVAGFDSEHLRILAGGFEPFDYFRMKSLIEKVLNELQIDCSDEEQIIKNYADYLIHKALDGKENFTKTLEMLTTLYCRTAHKHYFLSDFYQLEEIVDEPCYWGKNPTQEEIDNEIRKCFQEFLLSK